MDNNFMLMDRIQKIQQIIRQYGFRRGEYLAKNGGESDDSSN